MELKHFDTHICIISQELAPSFLPLRLPESKPKKMILLVSKEMQKRESIFVQILKKHQVAWQTIHLSENSIAEIHQKLYTYLAENKEEKLILNITGGTKPMAFAAFEVCQVHDVPAYYVDTQNKKIIFFDKGSPSEYPIKSVLSSKDILQLSGYTILSSDEQEISSDNRAFTLKLIENAEAWEQAVGTLNKYAAQAKHSSTLSVVRESEGKNFHQLLELCVHYKLLSFTSNSIIFPSEEIRFFLNGGWLEEYAYSVIRKMLAEKIIHDCSRNVKLTIPEYSKQGKAINELDIVFTANNILYLIEAKTKTISDMANKNNNQRSDEIVYQLDALKDKMGGIYTKAMFISYRKLNENDKTRAKHYKIEIVENFELAKLRDKLEKWIQKF